MRILPRMTSVGLYMAFMLVLFSACNQPSPQETAMVSQKTDDTPAASTPVFLETVAVPTATPRPAPTMTVVALPTSTLLPSPTDVLSETGESHLYQIVSDSLPAEPGTAQSVKWVSEDIFSIGFYQRDEESGRLVYYLQEFGVNESQDIVSVRPLAISKAGDHREQKIVLSTATAAALPGDIVDQVDSLDRTHSLVFVAVGSSTLPLIGNAEERPEDLNQPLVEGWVVDHTAAKMWPVLATQLGYYYEFLPGNRYIVVEQLCYGDHLGGGLHLIRLEDALLRTLTQSYTGNCEGGLPLMPSPDGQYLIHSDGTAVSVDGTVTADICSEGQYANSWTWSTDSRQVYVDCHDDERDVLWRYDVEIDQKELLDQFVDPHLSALPIRACKMAVSPDENWLAFIWGINPFFNLCDQNGVWLLRLSDGK